MGEIGMESWFVELTFFFPNIGKVVNSSSPQARRTEKVKLIVCITDI